VNVRVGAVLQVVADEEIEVAVAVVVEERRRNAPARIIRPALLRDVGKRPVTVVPEQLIRSEDRDVQVDAVKRNVRVPSAATVRSLRNRRLLSGSDPAGCGFAALSGFLPSI
jgi:hypothetical protein